MEQSPKVKQKKGKVLERLLRVTGGKTEEDREGKLKMTSRERLQSVVIQMPAGKKGLGGTGSVKVSLCQETP